MDTATTTRTPVPVLTRRSQASNVPTAHVGHTRVRADGRKTQKRSTLDLCSAFTQRIEEDCFDSVCVQQVIKVAEDLIGEILRNEAEEETRQPQSIPASPSVAAGDATTVAVARRGQKNRSARKAVQ